MIQYHPAEQFTRRAVDYFDCLYEEGAEQPRFMALACHPYISGSPHRARHVAETLEYITSKPDVLVWNGEQILDWYLKERPPAQE
jgi:hypothetical protein